MPQQCTWLSRAGQFLSVPYGMLVLQQRGFIRQLQMLRRQQGSRRTPSQVALLQQADSAAVCLAHFPAALC